MTVEIRTCAVLYRLLGALRPLGKTAYVPTVRFITLGLGDIALDEEGRPLSSFEAANGPLTFGRSTSIERRPRRTVRRKAGTRA